MMVHVELETPYFANRSQDGLIDYWPAHDKAGQAATDEGKSRADALVASIRVSQHPIALPFVVAAISKRGDFDLMERAFFHRLGEHLLP